MMFEKRIKGRVANDVKMCYYYMNADEAEKSKCNKRHPAARR
jgi:hypothetical protein